MKVSEISWILFKANVETLAERGKTDTDSPIWDKILLFAFWILNYFAVYLLADISENSEYLSFVRDSWRAGVSKTDKTELVMNGIYRISRNPAFLGFDLLYIGTLLMFFSWALCILTVFTKQ